MIYLDFLELLRDRLQEKGGDHYQICISKIMKTNQNRRCGITILAKKDSIGPTIYPEVFFEQYKQGMPMEKIVEQIFEVYQNSYHGNQIDMSYFSDFEQVRNQIYCKLINYDKNKYLLGHVPHKCFQDLAIVYYCNVELCDMPKGTILIKNEYLDLWGISEEELNAVAHQNTMLKQPFELLLFENILSNMGCYDISDYMAESFPMYILTNRQRTFGAVNLAFRSVLSEVAERLDDNYYVIPSSIHECILIPESSDVNPEILSEMVREVNAEEVEEDEILGDTIYYYDRWMQALVMAE